MRYESGLVNSGQKQKLSLDFYLDSSGEPSSKGDGEGQGSLECYCPWGHRESEMTEQQ